MKDDSTHKKTHKSDWNKNVDRVGDATNQSPTNKPVDKEYASKMANLLQGLDFPADRAKIISHVNDKLSSDESNDLREILQSNLKEKEYSNVYEIEKEVRLVTSKNKSKPNL